MKWAKQALIWRWTRIASGVDMVKAATTDMQLSGALIELYFGIAHSTWRNTRYLGFRGQLLEYWL